jgi:hypothetical protein
MTMYDTREQLVSELIQGAIERLDISPELHTAAELEYQMVGDWLADHADPSGEGWRVYPQGSFRLGTVVRPEGIDEYDLDAVCLRSIRKDQTSQATLKGEVGEVLDRYMLARTEDPDGPIAREERKRCWTLSYPAPFHIDVLPAIPNPETPPEGILLTDRKLREWQYSNPIAYANWFHNCMRRELIEKQVRLAEAERVPPEQVPFHTVKTTLQRVVQVLKVHRNRYFADDLDSRPPSILISTLAAHAYEGEALLDQAVLDTVRAMPGLVRYENDRWLVLNPVEPRENFADKWAEKPELATAFYEWLDRLEEDLLTARETEGIDRTVVALSESFGEPIRKAAAAIADGYRFQRERGTLRFSTATGALSLAGELPVRKHGFYGQN